MFANQLLIYLGSIVAVQAAAYGVVPPREPGDPAPEAVFERWDLDGDGALNLDEFKAGMHRRGNGHARAADPQRLDDRPMPPEAMADRPQPPGERRVGKAEGPMNQQNLERRIRQIVRDAVAGALRELAPDSGAPAVRGPDMQPAPWPAGPRRGGPGPERIMPCPCGRPRPDGRMGVPPMEQEPPQGQALARAPDGQRPAKGIRARGGRGRFGEPSGPQGRGGRRDDRMGRGAGFDRLDVNRDGFLTREEFRGRAARFDKAGREDNGRLDRREFRRERRWHRGEMSGAVDEGPDMRPPAPRPRAL